MEKTPTPIPQNIQDIIYCINEARTNPMKLANKITLATSYINKRDNILREPHRPIVKLNEGIKSYEEAIKFLKNFQALSPFQYEESLGKIAMEHAADIGHKGVVTSDSSDGRVKFEERFKKFATYTDLQEIILVGEPDPIRIIMNLIICDDDSNRTNRSIILSSELTQIGVGFDSHTKYNCVCVINLAQNWKLRQVTSNPNTQTQNIKDDASKNNSKDFTKLKDFTIDLAKGNSGEEGKNINLDEDLIEKYDKELDNQIWYEDYKEKKEEKFILTEEKNKIKLLKKITFTFPDGKIRKVILSKTWKV